MEIKYLTIFGFDYKEISGDCGEIDWKRLDFRKDKPIYKTGNVIVYLEIDFPPRDPGEDAQKPEYSGRFVTRRIKQTVRNHPVLQKGYVAILLEEFKHTDESLVAIRQEVKNIIAKYKQEGGLIPLP
jgi:hypothetical protein